MMGWIGMSSEEGGDCVDGEHCTRPVLASSVREAKEEDRVVAVKKDKADKSTQTEVPPLQKETERLALAVVRHQLGLSGAPEGRVACTLDRCVGQLLSRHAILFSGMVQRLNPHADTAYATFRGVAQELFTEGSMAEKGVTWGRLVALFAFAARLSVYCSQDQSLAHLREQPAYFLGEYVAEVATPFLQANGGWEGLCQHFPAPDDLEKRVWRTLLLAGLGLGLAATFLAIHS